MAQDKLCFFTLVLTPEQGVTHPWRAVGRYTDVQPMEIKVISVSSRVARYAASSQEVANERHILLVRFLLNKVRTLIHTIKS